MFTNAAFDYKIQYEYSCGGGITVLWANYENGELLVKWCQTEDGFEVLDEKTQEEYEEGEIGMSDIIEILMDEVEAFKVYPSRNFKYEKSFCEVENLLDYIGAE